MLLLHLMIKSIELLAVGGAYVDINCTQFPFGEQGLLPESEVVGNAYEVVPGGSALNFARFCANLGLKTAFIGKVGQDKMGALLGGLIEESGVQPELVSDAEATTNISLNLVSPAGKSIMAVAGNAKNRLTSEEVATKITSLLPETEYLMLGGVFKLKMLLPVFRPIVAAAKDAGTKIVVDHGRLVNGVTEEEIGFIKELIAQADYYFPSRDEFQQLWSTSSIEEGLERLTSETSTVTVVKDSTNGALAIVDGELVHVPAYPVTAINTIGAGDSFNAGFIASQKEGMTIEASMRFACATAALKISQRELPTRAAISSFIDSHK
jgi:ribokinase